MKKRGSRLNKKVAPLKPASPIDRLHSFPRAAAQRGGFDINQYADKILNRIVDGVWATDRDNIGIYISQALLDLIGIPKDKFLGFDVIKNCPKATLKHFAPAFNKARQTLNPVHYEAMLFVTPSGKKMFQSGWLIPMVERGEFSGMIGTVTDITERKRMENALKEAEKRFRLLFNVGSDSVFVHGGPDEKGFPGRFIEVNEAACERLGYTREEFLQLAPPDIDAPETVPLIPARIEQLKRDNYATWEGVHLTKNGRRIPVEISAHLFDFKGKPTIMSTARDITERKHNEEVVRFQRDRIQKYLDIAGVIFVALDADERITLINKKGCQILGYSEEELLGKNWFDMIIPAETRQEVRGVFRQTISSVNPQENDYQNLVLAKSGEKRLIAWHNTYLTDEQGQVIGTLSSGNDITQEKQIEDELRESEEKFRHLFELESDATFLVDKEMGRILEANTAASKLYGYSREEFLALKNTDISVEPDKTRIAVANQENFVPLRWHRKKNGTIFPVEITAGHFSWRSREVYIGSMRDITKRLEAEAVILDSLREKEVLLKEIHHRVKNNMQIISSLLSLQSRGVQDQAIIKIFRESQSRIRSIALAHEKLYLSRDLSHIDFSDYVQSLAVHLFQMNQTNPDLIKLKIELDNIFFDIQTAIPCGLILNELISNSLKHAFPKGRGGEITVTLHPLNKGEYRMTVGDDGIGLPKAIDLEDPKTFGLQIVTMLVHQLEGTIKLEKKPGTCFVILFKEVRFKSRL